MTRIFLSEAVCLGRRVLGDGMMKMFCFATCSRGICLFRGQHWFCDVTRKTPRSPWEEQKPRR